MRWSLILSTITVLSTLSVALVVPSSLVDLERRGGGAKLPSRRYRKNAALHGYAYNFNLQTGDVTREKLKPKDRLSHGTRLMGVPRTDADHMFEHQMLFNHLKYHDLKFENLDPKLQHKVKHILNRPKNMALVPARDNRSKGQVIKHAMKGKALKPNKSRDQYISISYTSARKTAMDLDKAFKKHGYNFEGKTFHNALRHAMNTAKILKPGDPSPVGSSRRSSGSGSVSSKASSHASGSSKASSHGSGKARRGKAVAGFTKKRRSARIAAAKHKS